MNSITRIVTLGLAIGINIVLAACYEAPVVTSAPPVQTEYVLGAGDTVHLVVYGDDTITGDYMLDKRGILTVPLIGEVHAAGLTKAALQADITTRLTTQGFLQKPYVTIDLTGLQPVYILGEVKNPGSYDYKPSLDVFKALALAGGYTPRAVKDKVVISRTGPKGRISFYAGESTPLMPGDSIKVAQRIF